MPIFNTLQKITSRLNELSEQLNSSKLTEEELREFEQLSRDLYERAIILNYKAKEERVFQKENEQKIKEPEEEQKIELNEEEITNSEIINDEIIEEEVIEKKTIENEAKEEEIQTQTTAYTQPETTSFQLDFSSAFETPIKKEFSKEMDKDSSVEKEDLKPATSPASLEGKADEFFKVFMYLCLISI